MSVELVYEIEDASGTKGSTSIKIAGTPTIAQINGFGAGWATAINNLIGGVIRSALAFFRVDISGLTGNTVLTYSDVEECGKFEFITGAGNRVRINIPAINDGVVGTTTSDNLDLADPQVSAFVDAMTDGVSVTGALIQPCDIGEDDITAVVFAREAFRNSGKRR